MNSKKNRYSNLNRYNIMTKAINLLPYRISFQNGVTFLLENVHEPNVRREPCDNVRFNSYLVFPIICENIHYDIVLIFYFMFTTTLSR